MLVFCCRSRELWFFLLSIRRNAHARRINWIFPIFTISMKMQNCSKHRCLSLCIFTAVSMMWVIRIDTLLILPFTTNVNISSTPNMSNIKKYLYVFVFFGLRTLRHSYPCFEKLWACFENSEILSAKTFNDFKTKNHRLLHFWTWQKKLRSLQKYTNVFFVIYQKNVNMIPDMSILEEILDYFFRCTWDTAFVLGHCSTTFIHPHVLLISNISLDQKISGTHCASRN